MRADAFILCGGKSTRLKGLNKHLPKALTKIKDRTLLSRLIESISPSLGRIYISYAGQKDIYLSSLGMELKEAEFNKLHFVLDSMQQGTALALRGFDSNTDQDCIVLNGVTIYNNYEAIFPNFIQPNEVIFSTSIQTIGTGGTISVNKTNNRLCYKKNRDTLNLSMGEITNGVISIGHAALKTLGSLKIEAGKSLEEFLLENQNNKTLRYHLHQTNAKFLDIGIPSVYQHVDICYEELISKAR